MGEGWWTYMGNTGWYPETGQNPSWKDGLDAMIDFETLYTNNYFIPMCYDYYDGKSNAPTGATVLQLARYCFASTLLGAQHNKNYLSLTNDAGYMEQFYKQLYSLDIGNQLGKYYVVTGTHVYARDFSKAKVLVNPSTSSYPISLGGSYKNLDGQTVSSITMNAHTGEILLKI
jgi:hypothetical protein